MQIACPKCGTRDVRVSHRRSWPERLRGLVGFYPLRCRRCKERWETSIWDTTAWRYARCPKCYRQELTTWDEHYYNPPFGTKFSLAFGARRYRCAACRFNFASFKRRKARFERQHEERNPAVPSAEPTSKQA